MPIFTFAYPPEQCKAGCVERIVVNGQFSKVVQNPQNGQPMRVPDPKAAWDWIKQFQLPFPGGSVVPGVEGPSETPKIVAIQITQPTVSAQQVNAGAPYGPPYANGRDMSPPPVQLPQGQVGKSGIETLHPSALPGTQDPFLDADPTGGTYTDIDSSGSEYVRDLDNPVPASPRRVPGQ